MSENEYKEKWVDAEYFAALKASLIKGSSESWLAHDSPRIYMKIFLFSGKEIAYAVYEWGEEIFYPDKNEAIFWKYPTKN